MKYDSLRDKYLLLDTNVLIYLTKYPPLMAGLLKAWEDAGITPILDDLVKFEFLRKAICPSEEIELKNFLQTIFKCSSVDIEKTQFPITDEIIKLSTGIANLYSWRLRNLHVELSDCFLAGEMRKYNQHHDQLFLATANHKHFPSLIFNRVGIEPVDAGDEIFTIGFYQFDRGKFEREIKAYRAQP